jgi:hypothetical protein
VNRKRTSRFNRSSNKGIISRLRRSAIGRFFGGLFSSGGHRMAKPRPRSKIKDSTEKKLKGNDSGGVGSGVTFGRGSVDRDALHVAQRIKNTNELFLSRTAKKSSISIRKISDPLESVVKDF